MQSQDTTIATEIGDPALTCMNCCGYSFGRAVWFKITPTNNARVNLSTCGSAFDTIIFNDTATTEIYTLSLHDALPISFCSGANKAGLSFSGVGGTTYYVMV